ncbi:ketoacyl-ACP synthase III [uncultured Imperialibacter sp.]|uniref:ketoacyl-ACP synthase III n=1 Tax=uncultured Imperialibacter sp. TaxID=1672639 RepID=UPI0030DAFEBF|tara:strand:+ start:67587 stop:68582 length:996 start_codon:yes stop_codon:yes gene_type:complete
MKVIRPFKIVGAGYCLPSKCVHSQEMEKDLGLPVGWIYKYSGVEKRHLATTESNSWLGAEALKKAMRNAGLQPEDLGCLIAASATFDYPLPNKASMIKHELGWHDTDLGCIDIDTTCLSFVTALDYASRLLNNSDCRHIAIVSAEIASKGLNPEHKETFSLFGDAAAAIIVSFDDTGESGLVKHRLVTYSEGAEHTIIRGGGNKFFFKDHPYDATLHSFSMEGKKLLKLAMQRVPEFTEKFFCEIALPIREVDLIIPHQASKSGLLLLDSLLDGNTDKVVNNLASYGNCIAASIPLALTEAIESGRLKRGDSCLLIGTAAGFSVGGLLFKF